MDDQEFAARLQRLDDQHEQFFEQLEKSARRHRESETEFQAQLDDLDRQTRASAEQQQRSRKQFQEKLDDLARLTQTLAERTQAFAQRTIQSEADFQERLALFDQRHVAFLRRMEGLGVEIQVLSGESGQIADELVEHKRDPDAHA